MTLKRLSSFFVLSLLSFFVLHTSVHANRDINKDVLSIAGISQEMLDDLKKDPNIAKKLKVIQKPADILEHKDMVPEIYQAYFNKHLKSVGGSKALEKVGNPYAAAAMADTFFRHGPHGGERVISSAINDMMGKDSLVKDTDNIKKSFPFYSELARSAKLDLLLDAVARQRVQQAERELAETLQKMAEEENILLSFDKALKRVKGKVLKDDLLRFDYFRFEKVRNKKK